MDEKKIELMKAIRKSKRDLGYVQKNLMKGNKTLLKGVLEEHIKDVQDFIAQIDLF
jgi:hypothetical protein